MDRKQALRGKVWHMKERCGWFDPAWYRRISAKSRRSWKRMANRIARRRGRHELQRHEDQRAQSR